MKRISKYYHLKLANRWNFITEWPNGRCQVAHSIEQMRQKKQILVCQSIFPVNLIVQNFYLFTKNQIRKKEEKTSSFLS